MKIKLLGWALVTLIASATFPTPEIQAQSNPVSTSSIHPRVLNALLRAAAPAWDMSLGETYQAYHAGRVTYIAGPQAEGGTVYYAWLDGDCTIIVVIDDTW